MITHVPPSVVGGNNFHEGIFPVDEFKDKLHLGCGRNYLKGFINVDVSTEVKADVYCNLEEPLPFKDNSFDLIYGAHILEHIRNLPELKLEFKRIVKYPGCMAFVVPYYLSPDAWGDDTHVRTFSEYSMWSFYWPGFKMLDWKKIPCTEQNTGDELIWLLGCFGKLPEDESS